MESEAYGGKRTDGMFVGRSRADHNGACAIVVGHVMVLVKEGEEESQAVRGSGGLVGR